MNKLTSYQWEVEEIERIRQSGIKPKLLLHSCCAICNSYPLEYLQDVFEITLYFNNSNLYPQSEYDIRLDELINYVDKFNCEQNTDIKIIVPPYDNVRYNETWLAKRSADREGNGRCWMCYSVRMNEAMQYANSHGFDYVSTVMTISRQKNSAKINDIASKLMSAYPNVHYFYSDFKKNKGIDRSVEISKSENMYRQQYCGCIYSFEQARLKGKLL